MIKITFCLVFVSVLVDLSEGINQPSKCYLPTSPLYPIIPEVNNPVDFPDFLVS